jgi:hypothetical protein
MAPKNAGLGGSSHQRRIASKAENRIADEAAKKVLQRMETNVTNPVKEGRFSFRCHRPEFLAAFRTLNPLKIHPLNLIRRDRETALRARLV